jgi:hypothetical protein
MNAVICPDAGLELRKQIERTVRPVRAGRDRKLVMREELYSHLTSLYLEETKQQPTEQAALAAALQRFGEPAALTKELDVSVGWLERYAYYGDFFTFCFSPRSGEPLVRFALRHCLVFWLLNTPTIILAPFLVTAGGGVWSDAATRFSFRWLLMLLVAGQSALVVAAWGMFRILHGSKSPVRWLWGGLLAISSAIVGSLFAILCWWLVAGSLPARDQVVRHVPVVAGFVPIALLISAWILNRAQYYRKKYEAWTTLAIDE